jgi:hypothetical protein
MEYAARLLAFPRLRRLSLEGGFVHQHDGDVVFDGVDPMALSALQALGSLAVLERLLAGGTYQDFE